MSAEFIDEFVTGLFVDPGPDEGARGTTPQNQRWKRCRGKDEGRLWCCECKVFVMWAQCPCTRRAATVADETTYIAPAPQTQTFSFGEPETRPEPELPEGRLIKFED